MKNTLTVLSILASLSLTAQYNLHGISYLGFGLGTGKISGSAKEFSPAYYSQGEFQASGTPITMVSRFSRLGKGSKWGAGLYFGLDVGGVNTKWKVENTNTNHDGGTQKDFDIYIDLRFGLQAAYKLPEKQTYVGARYFYHAMGDGQRNMLGNTDEGNAIGLFGAYKKLGFDLNYSSAGIPGLGITNTWKITELDLRYKLGTWDDGNYCWLIGLKAEHSTLTDYTFPDSDKIKANAVLLMFGFGTN